MCELEFNLNDKELFPFCVRNSERLGFLGPNTRETLAKLAHKVETSQLTSADGSDLVQLWKWLIIDAIHALKAHDKREKAWLEKDTDVPWIKASQIGARQQNVYGAESLFGFFEEFTKFEQLLYGTERHYRDHVAHPIRVWMTGIKIIMGWGGIERLEFDDNAGAGEISEVEKWAAWTIMSLCHDLGYPLEKAHKVTDLVDKMMEFFGNISTGRYRYSFQVHHQSLIETMLRAVASKLVKVDVSMPQDVRPPHADQPLKDAQGADLKGSRDSGSEMSGEQGKGVRDLRFTTVIQPKYYAKFSHSFEDFQHGIISVLVLLKCLVYFMEMDFDFSGRGSLGAEDARQFHIRREILRAIASHTCPEVYHLKLNTPSFLLIVCDDLQEWGRPSVASLILQEDPGSSRDGQDAKVCVGTCTVNRLSCSIEYPSHGKGEQKVKAEFGRYHKLLRAALDDRVRSFVFDWKVTQQDSEGKPLELHFNYDSNRAPFEELVIHKNDEDVTAMLFNEKDKFEANKT